MPIAGNRKPSAPRGEIELGEDVRAEAAEVRDEGNLSPLEPVQNAPEDQGELLKSKAPFTEPKQDPKKKVAGWDCTPSMDEGPDKSWVCSLTGRDPRGIAHVVSEPGEDVENWTTASSITRADEERFETLMGKLPVNPWSRSCAPKVGKKPPPPLAEFILTPEDKLARKGPADMHSDYFEMIDNEVVNFAGSAEMIRGDQMLWGDYITRNLKTEAVNAHGNVIYQDKGMVLSSDSGFMDNQTGRGVYRNSQFILPAVPGRGTSRITYVDSDVLSRYETFSYTTCPVGNQDWVLHSDNVKINKDTGIGSAQNAWFEFDDIPVFWAPYMSFPVDGRRASGFLSPNIGATQVSGFDFSIPYYFNIAPNIDATTQPRYITKRGFMTMNEFRYLTDTSRGKLIADILPYDQSAQSQDNTTLKNGQKIPTTRGQVGFRDESRFSEDLTTQIDANWVSDQYFLNQLGSPLSLIDAVNIPSRAIANYNTPIGGVSLIANYFQTIDPTVPKSAYPYFYLPKLQHAFSDNLGDSGVIFSNETQMAQISASSNQRTTGQRFLMRPKISMPMESSFGFIRPSATLAFNHYNLQDTQWWAQESLKPQGAVVPNSQTYEIPILSMDAGTYFDRDVEIGDHAMQHTLEPRLFYVYIPNVNQSNIPLFDTSSYDFTYYQLFRENRFTGYDRIGDANDLTAAITSRLIDQETGIERIRATVGNIAYFSPRNVTLLGSASGNPIVTDVTGTNYDQSFSNIVSDIYTGITESWGLYTAGQYNPVSNRIYRGQFGIQYNNKKNQILNLAYRFRTNQNTGTCPASTAQNTFAAQNDGCLNLTDVSFRLPIMAGWNAIGRWEYSLLNNVTLESFFGFERETCCWRFALIGRRYLNTITAQNEAQSNNAIFLQLELKGLTSLNDDVDKFLQRSITGFRYQDY